MAQRKIGAAYVEIITKGLAKVQKELESIRGDLKKTGDEKDKLADKSKSAFDGMGKAIEKLGAVAQRAFTVASGAITGFIKSADPVGFLRMQGTLAAISVQLGSIFLPLLDMVAKGLQRFLEWLRSLTNEQKDSIVHWTKVAGAITLAAIALPKLIALIKLVSSAFSLMGLTLGIATAGILPLIGALVATGETFGIFESLKDIFAVVIEAGLGLWEALKPVFEGLSEVVLFAFDSISSALEALGPLFETVFEIIASACRALQPVFETVFTAIKAAINAVAKTLVFVGTLLNSILRGNFKGAISRAMDAVDEYEKRQAEKKKTREEKRREKEDREGAGPAKGRHTPMAAQQVQLIAISELWRKAQQAQIESPEMKAQNERNRLAQQQLEELKSINRNTNGLSDREAGGGTGGDWGSPLSD